MRWMSNFQTWADFICSFQRGRNGDFCVFEWHQASLRADTRTSLYASWPRRVLIPCLEAETLLQTGNPVPGFQNPVQTHLPQHSTDEVNPHSAVSVLRWLCCFCIWHSLLESVSPTCVCSHPLLDWAPCSRRLCPSLNGNPAPTTEPGTR